MKTTILVADNDPDLLSTVRTYLKKNGFSVIVAKSLPQAKRRLQEENFDLAILDVRLREDDDDKDKSGLMLARTYAPRKPKIILTSRPRYTTVRESLRLVGGGPAAVDLVPKEGGLPKVLSAVKSAVRKAEYLKKLSDLRSGDSTAWQQVWDDEAWRLISLARRHGVAKDEAQDICVKVFSGLARAKRPPRATTLRAALVGETLRQIKGLGPNRGVNGRRQARKAIGDSPAIEALREDIFAPAVEEMISKDELVKQIKQAIKELPATQQKVIVMYLFEGASAPSIAQSLSLKEKTVNRHLKEAGASLKDKLAELE
jgi:RNA polymerase sigma factor (sigma-70 family)